MTDVNENERRRGKYCQVCRVCTPPHPWGSAHPPSRNLAVEGLRGGDRIGYPGCAGCKGSTSLKRTRASTYTHTRNKSRLDPAHPEHAESRGENGRVQASTPDLAGPECAPPGVHTDPPGSAHLNGLTIVRGGSHA